MLAQRSFLSPPIKIGSSFCVRPQRQSVSVKLQSGGGSGVIERPGLQTGEVTKDTTKSKKAPKYKVLLHNDSFNKREYVVKVLMKVVDGLTMAEAINVMQEAHFNGVGLVIICMIENAQQYCAGLRSGGLRSTIEPDK
eukprot:TRINITY_DN4488_c0_g1_i6.p1 TRINITY_DN4488_c0_g1~~TRINITY_DN4488_c0_g1_i6.p1  ORF type:complete len:138 (-),score=12.33 TRINITY_DN4488_c0_g1_i6:296-709(-)